ncbi:unnamed protein product [Hymenolepis diminuta]|uniref:protein-tyrosine-phosphatase n=1 Tax=Hymenolepis diminuta TaxID=6216 RepID=A0A0R3SWB9_HYMDI|nr:unnamed protein product [Hymenolepis diminuta]
MEGVNLPSLLIQLRQCRMGIIQTAQQLRYSYAAVIEGGKLLLATPTEERTSLVFPEHNRLADDDDDDNNDEIESDSTTSEDSFSDNDDDSSVDSDNASDEVIDLPAEVHLPEDIHAERELLRHLWLRSGDGCGMEDDYSTSGSSNEENEVEIMQLFNHRKSHHHNHTFESSCRPVEFEVLENGDVIKETCKKAGVLMSEFKCHNGSTFQYWNIDSDELAGWQDGWPDESS